MSRQHRHEDPVASVPHSWKISEWSERAPHIYPGDTDKARYTVRVHKPELIACGAIARVGRDLIAFGRPYTRWLEKKTAAVPGFDIAPNRSSEQPAT